MVTDEILKERIKLINEMNEGTPNWLTDIVDGEIKEIISYFKNHDESVWITDMIIGVLKEFITRKEN